MIVFVAIAALMISGSYADNEDLEPKNLCSIMVDGTRIRDITSCENYYICTGGIADHRSCPPGQQYNKDRQQCTDPSISTCGTIVGDITQICRGVAKGKWVADPSSCDGFYYCNGSGNGGQKGFCTSGLYFDESGQKCEHSEKSICDKGTGDVDSVNAICSIVPNGVYFGSSKSCNYWAVCENGIYSSKICDVGTKFNTRDGYCDYVSRCTQIPSEGPTIPGNPYDDPLAIGGDCTEAQVNTYKTDGTCVGFYWCSNISKQWLRGVCSDYRAFDPVTNKCVARSQKSCPNDPCRNTKGSLIRWVNDANNCRTYIHCQNNQEIGTGECTSGLSFNVDSQTCVKQLDSKYAACSQGVKPGPPDSTPEPEPEPGTPETGNNGNPGGPPGPDDSETGNNGSGNANPVPPTV